MRKQSQVNTFAAGQQQLSQIFPHCVLLDFCSELTFHLLTYKEIRRRGFMSHLIVSLSVTVDGEKLVMKGAKLTSSEMMSAFQSQCKAKDPQSKTAAKK